jgi:hypothetical protein
MPHGLPNAAMHARSTGRVVGFVKRLLFILRLPTLRAARWREGSGAGPIRCD